MKNNKGFSLVELIIVIAIMAILVGVMAPQLIKYIEKTNVSSDTQLCDTVKNAITTAMMDPSVVTNPSAGIPSANNPTNVSNIGTSTDDTTFAGAVTEILGFDPTNIDNQIKSEARPGKNGGSVMYEIVGSNSVHVWITNSDNTGKKGSYGRGDSYDRCRKGN